MIQTFTLIGVVGKIIFLVYLVHQQEKEIERSIQEIYDSYSESGIENQPTKPASTPEIEPQPTEPTTTTETGELKMKAILHQMKLELTSPQVDELNTIYNNNSALLQRIAKEFHNMYKYDNNMVHSLDMLVEMVGQAVRQSIDSPKLARIVDEDIQRSKALSYLGAKALQNVWTGETG